MAARQRDDLLGVDLEEAGGGDRADREGALGAFEAQAGPRAAGHQDHADLAGRQGIRADPRGAAHRHPLAVGLRQPERLDRPHAIGGRRAGALAVHQLADQPIELLEVDRGHVRRQSLTPGVVQLLPPA